MKMGDSGVNRMVLVLRKDGLERMWTGSACPVCGKEHHGAGSVGDDSRPDYATEDAMGERNHVEPMSHNYVRKLLRLLEDKEGIGVLEHVLIRHDSWCGIYNGKPCNCDPEIVFPEEN